MLGRAVLPGTESLWAILLVALVALAVVVPLRSLVPGRRQRGNAARLFLGLAVGLAGLGLVAAALGIEDAFHAIELAATVALVTGLVGTLGFVVFDLILARAGVELSPILRDLIEVAASVVVTLALLRAWGFNVLGLVTTSAVLTAVIGLALQTTLSNVFGGLALQLDRTVVQGDWIQVTGNTGRVLDIGWRATRLVTPDGNTIVVPNGQLVSAELINFLRPTGAARRAVQVGFHYRHPPNDVREAMLRAIRDVPGVLPHPAPDCVPVDFADSAVVYAVRYWTADLERALPIDGEVRTRIWYAARRAGLEIPFPIRTLVGTPAAIETPPIGAVPDDPARLALLRRVDLFAPLDDGERRVVATAMRRLQFATGEPIVTQGDDGDSLYLVERGQVGVYLTVGSAIRELATLRAGDVFGEMSLLTGEPRTASCVAHGDVTCYVIDRDVFQRVIAAKPGIAEPLAERLAARRVALEASREGLSVAARVRRTEEEQKRLLPRIRDFLRVS
ncbi:MAG: mechanosensitive ion channel family protein [Candidatus Binatia bacterium]